MNTTATTLKNRKKNEKRKRCRSESLAKADLTGWTPFTQYHFYRYIGVERLEWWPSTNKFRWRERIINAQEAAQVMK